MRKMSARTVPVPFVVLALAGAAFTAGCGSSDNSNSGSSGSSGSTASSSTSGGSTSSSAAGSKGSLTFFVQTTIQSQFQNLAESVAGAKAAANAINHAGGIKGQKINIEFCDDKGTPAGARNCAQQAVAKKAVAIQMTSNFSPIMFPLLKAAHIPAIGNNPFSEADLTDPDSYGMTPGTDTLFELTGYVAKNLGAKSLAVASYDIGTAVHNSDVQKDPATKQGVGFKSVVTFPATTTDYSPIVQKLKNTGAEALSFVTAGQAIPPILQTAKQLGYTPKLVGNGTVQDAATLKSGGPLLEGMEIGSPVPAMNDPQLAQFRNDMAAAQKAGVADADKLDSTSLLPWLAVQGFAEVAKKMTKPVTGENLIAALNATKDVKVANFLDWKPGVPGPASKPRLASATFWVTKVQGGKVVTASPAQDAYKILGIS